MLIEAVEQRVRYRLLNGHEVCLRPGVPMELPEPAARQLLKKAAGKVRVVQDNTIDHAIRGVMQTAQELQVISPPSPVVREPATVPLTVEQLVGSVVIWCNERGLVRDTQQDRAVRWIWVETATRAGWTRTVKEGALCRRCHGERWWWSKAVTTPCGFSHDGVQHLDSETGQLKGPSRRADRDHLDECRRHRFRITPSLAILCVACHPPVPSHGDWSAAWHDIAELSCGLTDPLGARLRRGVRSRRV
jgi:hypothetical protein